MSDESDAAERLKVASDPNTPAATLADLAYDHPDLRVAIVGNPAAYQGLLDWLGELGDHAVNSALAIRSHGVSEAEASHLLRLTNAPQSALPEDGAPIILPATPTEHLAPILEERAAARSRWPAFATRRFLILIGGIVGLLVAAIIIASSVHGASGAALASAEAKAQRAAADKANGSNSAHDSSPTHSPSSTPGPTSTPVPLPPPSIVPSGFNQTWSQGFVGTGGYTETVAVSVGYPEKLGSTYPRQVSTGDCTNSVLNSGCTTATFTSGKSCTASKATDAVVPISVDITSTTSAFSQIVGARLQFQSGSQLQYEAYYNTGPQCNSGSNGTLAETGVSTSPVKNGERTSLPIFLIIANYYTPDHPNGNPSLLANTVIYVSGDSTSTIGWSSDGKPVIHQIGDSPSAMLPAGSSIRLG